MATPSSRTSPTRTEGALKLSAGTLYRSIQRMLEQGLLVETRERPAPEFDDERRRYYRITPHSARRWPAPKRVARRNWSSWRARQGSPRGRPDDAFLSSGCCTSIPRLSAHEYGGEMSRALRAQSREAARRVRRRRALWLTTFAEIALERGAGALDILRQDLSATLRACCRRAPGFRAHRRRDRRARHRREHGGVFGDRLRPAPAAAVSRSRNGW